MAAETKINEIFASIQGEGAIVGYKQIFIRFCGCNLKCAYCDTEFNTGKTYTPESLYEELIKQYDLKTFHSVSLTGGEPLLSFAFLKEFLPLIKDKTKIYLETNAVLIKEFEQVKDYIDIVGADIKLPSASGMDILDLNRKFFEQCRGIKTFAKIVFNKNITKEEIDFCTKTAKDTGIELILQPEMKEDKMAVNPDFCVEILDEFTLKYQNTRLIPQVHKFIDVR